MDPLSFSLLDPDPDPPSICGSGSRRVSLSTKKARIRIKTGARIRIQTGATQEGTGFLPDEVVLDTVAGHKLCILFLAGLWQVARAMGG